MTSQECSDALQTLNDIRYAIQQAPVTELSEPLLQLLQVVAGIIGDLHCR